MIVAQPTGIGRLRLPPIWLLVLAGIGGALLLIVAVNRWGAPSDEHAYWLAAQRLIAGQPLYDPTASLDTPYAYWYPPTFAQVLVPIAAVLPSEWFTAAWTVLLLVCLWWLGLRNPLGALALVAFIPVAVELWFRNVHLVLAVLLVLAIRRWPALFVAGAAIKIAPGLGVLYLAARGRWRDAALVTGVGIAVLAVSVVLSPGAWGAFFSDVVARGPGQAPGLIPVPYGVRAVAGAALAVIAGRLHPRYGEPLLIVGVTLASPSLYATAFSMLVAIVPLVILRRRDQRAAASAATQSFPATPSAMATATYTPAR